MLSKNDIFFVSDFKGLTISHSVDLERVLYLKRKLYNALFEKKKEFLSWKALEKLR